jgi:hypothetical protein
VRDIFPLPLPLPFHFPSTFFPLRFFHASPCVHHALLEMNHNVLLLLQLYDDDDYNYYFYYYCYLTTTLPERNGRATRLLR